MASELTGIVPADVLDSVLGVAEDVASQERLLVTVKWDALRLASADCRALWWTVVLYHPRTGGSSRQDVETLENVFALLAARVGRRTSPQSRSDSELCDLRSWEYLCLTFGYTTSEVPGWRLDGRNADGPVSRRLPGKRSEWIPALG